MADKEKFLKMGVNVINPAQLRRDTAFDPNELDDAMINQAGLFSYYAEVAAQAQARSDNQRMMRDITESKLDKQVRDQAADDGVKLTEKQVESTVKRDPRWIKAQKTHNDAKAEADLCRHALEALKQKKDMMVQIGVNAREEMKGEVRVRTAASAAEARETHSTNLKENALRVLREGKA